MVLMDTVMMWILWMMVRSPMAVVTVMLHLLLTMLFDSDLFEHILLVRQNNRRQVAFWLTNYLYRRLQDRLYYSLALLLIALRNEVHHLSAKIDIWRH